MKLTNKQREIAELLHLAACLRVTDSPTSWQNAQRLALAVTHGRTLRKRYENTCNYDYANTDAYLKRTENLERRAHANLAGLITAKRVAVHVEHNRDPRGCALRVTVLENVKGHGKPTPATMGAQSRVFYL